MLNQFTSWLHPSATRDSVRYWASACVWLLTCLLCITTQAGTPNEAETLYDLGMDSLEPGPNRNPALALARFYQATLARPGFSEAHKAVEHVVASEPQLSDFDTSSRLDPISRKIRQYVPLLPLVLLGSLTGTALFWMLARDRYRRTLAQRSGELYSAGRRVHWVLSIAFVLHLAVLALWWKPILFRKGIVITSASVSASALAAPDQNSSPLFPIANGQLIEVDRIEGDWALIENRDERRGWVPLKQLAVLNGIVPDAESANENGEQK